MNETPTPVLDHATFQRVWRRVMPQDRTDCPFTLEDPGLTPTVPQPLTRAVPAPLPAPADPPQSIPCLGEASLGELPVLEARMDHAALCRNAYRSLARRRGQQGSFASLAAAKSQQLRRLAAAYFLISGKDYAPRPEGTVTAKTTVAQALRARFRAEQMEAAALMDAAQASADPCLAQLYRELAEENRMLADRVRAILEQEKR